MCTQIDRRYRRQVVRLVLEAYKNGLIKPCKYYLIKSEPAPRGEQTHTPKCANNWGEEIPYKRNQSRRRVKPSTGRNPDYSLKSIRICRGCPEGEFEEDENFEARLMEQPQETSFVRGVPPAESVIPDSNDTLKHSKTEKADQFEKIYQNRDGDVMAMLPGGKAEELFSAKTKTIPAVITRSLCLRRIRKVESHILQEDLKRDNDPSEQDIRNWVNGLKGQCKKVFGEEAADWIHVVRTVGLSIKVEVKNKPFSNLIERCPKCKREYKSEDESETECPACQTPREKGTPQVLDDLKDRINADKI